MKKSDLLARELTRVLAEEARIEEAYGADLPDGSVIAFCIRINPTSRTVYSYAAIRAAGLWYTTGPQSPKGYTWDELTRWLDSMASVSRFKVLKTGTTPKPKKAAKK